MGVLVDRFVHVDGLVVLLVEPAAQGAHADVTLAALVAQPQARHGILPDRIPILGRGPALVSRVRRARLERHQPLVQRHVVS